MALPLWLWTGALAAAAALMHQLLGWQTGMLAGSLEPTRVDAGLMAAVALLYGWWGASLYQAGRRERSALLSLALFQLFWVVATPLLTLATCLPPCGAAFPYLDGARAAAVLLGLVSMRSAWHEYGRRRKAVRWGGPALMVVLAGAAIGLQAFILYF